MDHRYVTTGLGFEGFKITGYFGIVRGITVRSRSVVGNLGASIQTIFGGNINPAGNAGGPLPSST